MSLRITRPEDVGALIRDRRRALKLSQAELGKRLRVSRKWVSELEGGKASAHLGMVLSALQALGITLAVDHADLSRSASRSPPTDAAPSRVRRPAISIKDIVDG